MRLIRFLFFGVALIVVLCSGGNAEAAAPALCVAEGEGIGAYIVGDRKCTREFIISNLGEPDEKGDHFLHYSDSGMTFVLASDVNVLIEIRFTQNFEGRLCSCISIGSDIKEVFQIYGTPVAEERVSDFASSPWKDQTLFQKAEYKKIGYAAKGVLFWFKDDRVSEIVVFSKSRPKVSPDVLMSNDPAAARKELERLQIPFTADEATERAAAGDIDTVNLLLIAGMPADARNTDGGTMMRVAALRGNTDIMELLLQRGAQVNESGNARMSPLMSAVRNERTDAVRLLLEWGANPNMQEISSDGELGWTPLHRASRKGNVEIVNMLLDHGADPDVKDSGGSTALMLASENGYEESVKALISHGADINARDYGGYTSLHEAAGEGRVEIVKLLLDAGAHVNVKAGGHITPLTSAMWRDRHAVVEILKAAGGRE